MAKILKNKPLVHRGRPFKADKDEWTQVTCMLRIETLERLRAGAGSLRFGNFLQDHLDHYPPPTRKQYLASQVQYAPVKVGELSLLSREEWKEKKAAQRAARKAAREQARRDKLSPQERAREDALHAELARIVEETYAEKMQDQALANWAEQHGRTWKEALRRAWITGIYPEGSDKETLIKVKDQHGPGWLAKYKLKAPDIYEELLNAV